MTAYELMFILRAELDEKKQTDLIEKTRKIIEGHGGKISKENNVGKKPLAAQFKKQKQGIYVLVCYEAENTDKLNKDLNEHFKISDGVIRHLVIRLAPHREATKEARRAAKKKQAAQTLELQPEKTE